MNWVLVLLLVLVLVLVVDYRHPISVLVEGGCRNNCSCVCSATAGVAGVAGGRTAPPE